MIFLLLRCIHKIFNLFLFLLNHLIKGYKGIRTNNINIKPVNSFIKLSLEYIYKFLKVWIIICD